MTTVSEVVARIVAEHTSEIFALMGNGNAYFTDALARDGKVRMTGLRHEAGTVASADAYYRVSRKIAVATTTFGPGYTNAITPLAEAVQSRTPMVFVVGGQPTTGPRPWDVDQVAIATSVGAPTITVMTSNPAQATTDAFDMALAQRVPVVLCIPHDIGAAQAEPEPNVVAAAVPAAPEVPGRVLDDVVPLLVGARRPLIIAGRGAREAAGLLGELADRLGGLTASSAPARGTFAGRRYDLGVCGGFASEASSDLIRTADVVLVAGAGLNQFTTAFNTQFNPDAQLIQIDLAQDKTNDRVNVFLRGDAKPTLEALLSRLETHAPPATPWAGEAEHARDSTLNFTRDTGTGQAEDGLLDPRSAMHRLNEILPVNRQVVSDGGHFIGWSSYYFDLPAPDSLIMVGTQYQSIGLGLPSAPGAARARPDATTIVATGDGGGAMGLPDLHALVQTAKSAVVLVFNDACYGAEIHQYGSQGLDEQIMEIEQLDFATVAKGFGAQGVVVNTLDELDQVQTWVDDGARGTLVVDLRISRNIVAPYILEIIELTIKR
ncbi:thiamine pyrophosphate-binding protein [Enteractinococcus coprophilus]|uniref:Thiamine pyrophosphate-dependent acetolactate synthase large subunit-like protein n=1 Tax=Enteractinococcus coprophilus TaxID=1027633 RepID=A0A543AN22_9MICC|nr:thiamine pyrophosphate-binding protein [Enteractinococcus coprophilus]TQL73959.1 thiamine pyrophosphate-dependent acetolactate synthase large subunit-like protein [Enteractinococcus coprophilus]